MSEAIHVLLPCRAGSKRVKDKNTRPFAGTTLLHNKIEQLLSVPSITDIYVSTDDEKVIAIAKEFGDARVIVQKRDTYYTSDACTNDELISYFAETTGGEGLVLWTHVTSPFCDEHVYTRAIEEYVKNKEEHDSAVAVTPLRGYIWDEQQQPLNYDATQGRWPKTQDIMPSYFINSAFFLLPLTVMKQKRDRVGDTPLYHMLNVIEGFDIDWEDDFTLGEKMWSMMRK